VKLYGIRNCDKVKRARSWLDAHGHAIPFHDFKKDGIDRDLLAGWLRQTDWQALLNRQGTTWKKLSIDEKNAVTDESAAILLMLEKPSVIKRPVLESDDRLVLGFDEKTYLECFDK
jgi:arsenate reductase